MTTHTNPAPALAAMHTSVVIPFQAAHPMPEPQDRMAVMIGDLKDKAKFSQALADEAIAEVLELRAKISRLEATEVSQLTRVLDNIEQLMTDASNDLSEAKTATANVLRNVNMLNQAACTMAQGQPWWQAQTNSTVKLAEIAAGKIRTAIRIVNEVSDTAETHKTLSQREDEADVRPEDMAGLEY